MVNRYSFEGGEPLIMPSVCACHEGGDAGEVCYRPGEIHDMGDNPDFAAGEPWLGPWMRREPDAEPGAETPPAAPAAGETTAPAPAPAAQPPPGTAAAAPVPAPGPEGA